MASLSLTADGLLTRLRDLGYLIVLTGTKTLRFRLGTQILGPNSGQSYETGDGGEMFCTSTGYVYLLDEEHKLIANALVSSEDGMQTIVDAFLKKWPRP